MTITKLTNTNSSVAGNAKWLSLAQAAKLLIQFIGLAVLSRLLSPVEYGIMAMATVVTNLGGLLRDLGTGPAIIRTKELTVSRVNSVFWLNVFSGILVAAFVAIFAAYIARSFKSDQLETVLYGLAFTFPLMAIGAAHQALLERASNFRVVARSDVTSYLIGMIAAVVSAFCGLGVYSLVIQALIQAAVSSAQMFYASGWRPTFSMDMAELRAILGFSSKLTTSNFITYITRNADTVIAGKVLGAIALGPYSLAYKVMLYPLQNISLVVSKALFPILSLHQSNNEILRKYYLQSLSFVAFITAALMGGLMGCRESFVIVVFGIKWQSVSMILLWLAPVGFFQALLSTAPSVFMAKGRAGKLLVINAVMTCIHVGFWLIGAHYGLQGLVKAYLFATLISSSLFLYMLSDLLDITAYSLYRSLFPQILLGVCVAAGSFLGDKLAECMSLAMMYRLIFSCLIGSLVFYFYSSRFSKSNLDALFKAFHRKSKEA